MEEAQIIDMVRAGEVDAFAEIVEHYQSPIQRYLFRLTGDYQIAQDLAQDTFLQAYKGILKTKADLSLKACFIVLPPTTHCNTTGERDGCPSFLSMAAKNPISRPRKTKQALSVRRWQYRRLCLRCPKNKKHAWCFILWRDSNTKKLLKLSEYQRMPYVSEWREGNRNSECYTKEVRANEVRGFRGIIICLCGW